VCSTLAWSHTSRRFIITVTPRLTRFVLTVRFFTAALQASQQPAADLPNSLMNALASFVASVSEPALVQVLVPLVNAVVAEASGAAGGQGPAGKGKAGLFVMVAVVLRTRPQVRA